jgi:hypothetical protein
VIFPLRVFVSAGAYWIASGEAIGPISLRDPLMSGTSFCRLRFCTAITRRPSTLRATPPPTDAMIPQLYAALCRRDCGPQAAWNTWPLIGRGAAWQN